MAARQTRHFLQLLATNVLTKGCWALTLLLLLRQLGAAQFGVLATLWAAAGIAAGFVDLGTGQALLREGSRDHGVARHLAKQSATVQIVFTVVAIGLLVAGALAIMQIPDMTPAQRLIVIVLAVATPLIDRFQTLFTVFSQIGDNYNVYSLIRSAYFVLVLLVITWVLFQGGELVAVSVAYFSVNLVFTAIMGARIWVLLPTAGIQSVQPSTRHLLRQGLPFLLVMGLTLTYGRIDVALLGAFGMSAAAGSFHVIYQMVLIVYSVCGLFFTVVYPRLYQHHGNREALTRDFRDTVRWLAVLGWLAALPLWLFPAPILQLLGGSGLTNYVNLTRVLAVLILLVPATAALNFLLPTDKLRTRILCDLAGIAVNVAIALWAVMHQVPTWVAVAEVAGYLTAMSIAHIALHRVLSSPLRALGAEYLQSGVRVLPAAVVAWWLPAPWWLGLAVFVIMAGMLLLTYAPVRRRAKTWLTQLDWCGSRHA